MGLDQGPAGDYLATVYFKLNLRVSTELSVQHLSPLRPLFDFMLNSLYLVGDLEIQFEALSLER